MKKLLLSSSIVTLLLPALAFAAFDDVRLTTDTVLSVNGITVNVSGTQATIESIEVGSTTFVVTIETGSSFQVTAPDLNKLVADVGQWRSVDTCTGSSSVLAYDAAVSGSELVVTVTPSATLCADAATTSSSSSKSDAGGGGGGAPVVKQATPVVPVVQVTNNAEAIAAIKAQLISLIQQLILLLSQEILTLQANGSY